MTVKVLCLVFLAVGCISAEIVNYSQCPADEEICKISEVRIDPCKQAPKACRLKKGTNVTISFDYTPNFDATEAKQAVYWVSGSVEIPFSEVHDKACPYTTCGLQTGKPNTYAYTLYLNKKLPQGSYTIKWKVWNEREYDVSQVCCFVTDIVLVR